MKFARVRSALCPLVAALCCLLVSRSELSATESALLPLPAAQRDAGEVLTLIAAAIGQPDPARPSLGTSLADYAKNTGTQSTRYETFAEASRRILASGPIVNISPDATSRRLTVLADSLFASLATLEAIRADLRPDNFVTAAPRLRATAHLARFHARRILAAIHYNLFLRGQRLAELYAATMDARTTVEIWRELTAVAVEHPSLTLDAATPSLPLATAWRETLTRLEFDYRDLEAMCCPPDEGMLREKIWTPAAP